MSQFGHLSNDGLPNGEMQLAINLQIEWIQSNFTMKVAQTVARILLDAEHHIQIAQEPRDLLKDGINGKRNGAAGRSPKAADRHTYCGVIFP